VPLPARILAAVRQKYPGLDPERTGHELVRRQITAMVEDVIASTQAQLQALQPQDPDDVRDAGHALVAFSPSMAEAERELKSFLYAHLYRHPQVMQVRTGAEKIVRGLFDAYFDDPGTMPEGWREGLDDATDAGKARHVADFLAGMTDTYAVKEYRRLFDHAPELG
jgi:dGTPase